MTKVRRNQEIRSDHRKPVSPGGSWRRLLRCNIAFSKLGLPDRELCGQPADKRSRTLGPILATLSILAITGCAGEGSRLQSGLTVNPSIVATANVAIGNSKTQVVTLTNITNATLTINRAALIGNGFKAVGLPLPLSLPSGQSFSFDLQFAPASIGNITGTLSLVNDGPQSPFKVPLFGSGVAKSSPSIPASVSIAVVPSSVTISAGASVQFTATVSGSPNPTVNWAVGGGSPTFGSISSTGTYTAPTSLPSPATVTVTATSAASSSATASSAVTLINPAPPPPPTSTSNGSVPVFNVLDSGATVNTNVDATGAINSIVAALPMSGGTVYLPAGTYAIKSAVTTLTINQAHVNFQCAPGAILQAQTGFQTGAAILDIQGSATDVLVQGCVFDGNSVSGQGFRIDGGAAGVSIDHVETKNQTQTGGRGMLRTGGLVQITNSYFHDVPIGYYDFVGAGGTPSLKVDGNHFDRITGSPNSIASGSSGLNYFEASNNVFANITAGTQEVLYCYGCDKVDWQNNQFANVFGAIHCDTCGGGTISFNTATNSTGGVDFFPEVGSNLTIEGNTSTNDAGERGIVLGVGSSSQGVASLRAQVTSFDSTTGFTPGSNVSLTTDGADKQEGTGSMVASANGSFTTGTLWSFDFGAAQTFWVPYQDIWIKPTSGALSAGQLQLCMSVNKAISTCDLPVSLPAVAQNTWYRVITYATGWEGALSINGQSSPGFNSFGIRVATSSPGLVVKFDDFDKATELLGYVARSNTIVNPGSSCMTFGALEGGIVSNNYCENPSGGSSTAYGDENSAGVTFLGNKSSFSSATSGTVHLLVDAPSSAANVTASGDNTNAATMFSCTNGGQVFPGP